MQFLTAIGDEQEQRHLPTAACQVQQQVQAQIITPVGILTTSSTGCCAACSVTKWVMAAKSRRFSSSGFTDDDAGRVARSGNSSDSSGSRRESVEAKECIGSGSEVGVQRAKYARKRSSSGAYGDALSVWKHCPS